MTDATLADRPAQDTSAVHNKPAAQSDSAAARPLLVASPLATLAAGVMMGIAANDSYRMPAWLPWVLAAMAWLGWVASRRARLGALAAVFCVMAAGTAAGIAWHDLRFNHVASDHIARYVPVDEPVLVRVRGTVDSPVEIDSIDDPTRRMPFPTEPATRFTVQVRGIVTAQGELGTSGRMRVRVNAPALHLQMGDGVTLLGFVRRIMPPTNPGQRDWSVFHRRNGVLVTMNCDNERCVVVDQRTGSAIARWLLQARARLRGWLVFDDDVGGPDNADTLLDAIVLAQRGSVERSLDEAFLKTGVTHFLSASGANVAWLAWMVWVAGMLCGLSHRGRTIAVMISLAAYVMIAEHNAPINRAGITGILLCISQLARRMPGVVNGMAAAALVILTLNPCEMFSVGFQFSFVIAGVLCLLMPAAAQCWAAQSATVEGLALPELTEAPYWWTRFKGMLRAALTTCIAAWVAAVPIAAWHFQWLSVWAWLFSLVMSPVVFLMTLLGFLKLPLAALWPSFSAVVAYPLTGLTELLAQMAQLFSQAPGCQLQVPRPGIVWVVSYFAVVCFAIAVVRRAAQAAMPPVLQPRLPSRTEPTLPWTTPKALAWYCVAALSALWVIWLAPSQPRGAALGRLHVWQLAVGDGTATIIELPGGRAMAFDLGSRQFAGAAKSIIVPFLHHRGIARLESVIVSHPDADHYGAVLDVSKQVPVGRVIVNPMFESQSRDDEFAMQFLQECRNGGMPVEVVKAGDKWQIDGVDMEVLWPRLDSPRTKLEDNDTATVMRIRWNGVAVLLTGDIGDAAMSALLAESAAFLHADVVALPHHGSTQTRRLRRFLDATGAGTVIRSTARRDRDTQSVLWHMIGERRYYSTAELGAIDVQIGPSGMEVTPFIGKN